MAIGKDGIGARWTSVALMLAALCLVAAGCARTGSLVREEDRPPRFPPMVLDKATGHYKDMSYEALSDEGLSWEERTRLFGGDTASYGPLTAKQRKAKQKELQELLAKIDMKLVAKCEADIRAWLDERAKRPLANADWKQDWSIFTRRSTWHLSFGAVTFFRAYEIWGDKKYLEAGLKRADVYLRDQDPRGNWRRNRGSNDGRTCRIQDKNQDAPFFIMLYAYKVTGDKKYFESARRCADLLLTLQRPDSGGWGDQWLFDGAPKVNSGVIHGTSHNDCATTSPFTMMVMMYHMTKDKKYIANLHKLGPHIVKTNLGKGGRVGWAEAYRDGGAPQRVRQYEIEIVYPASITRSVGPLLIWLYLMDGNEAHMELLKKAYAWFEEARRFDLKPENYKAWKIVMDAHQKAGGSRERLYPGWAHAYLPDNSNCGWVTGYRMYPFYPVTPEQRKKWGHFIHNVEGGRGTLFKWAKAVQAGKPPVKTGQGNGIGNTMSQVRRALLEHKRGGREGLLKYYTNPVKYTPDQYLQARLDAAKRALDPRNVRLAAMHEKGIKSRPDCASLLKPKCRWYGPKHTKWGRAYDDAIQSGWGSTAIYQWQLVYDAMIARGKIDADAAARGGRGMEQWFSSMSHLDSWDVIGQYDMHAFEVENHFDVPIAK